MTKNAKIFQDFLSQEGLECDFEDYKGNIVVDINQSLKGGVNATVSIFFSKCDSFIGVLGFGFMGTMNQSQRSKLLDLTNKLNDYYNSFKFVITNDRIRVKSFIHVKNNFEPEILFDQILDMFDAIEDEYPNIMKVMWST